MSREEKIKLIMEHYNTTDEVKSADYLFDLKESELDVLIKIITHESKR